MDKDNHKCENPGCNNVAIKQYKSGWCCSIHCALSLAAKHSNLDRKPVHNHHKCNKCDLEFATKKELHQHKVDVHYGNEIYICICGKEFHSKRSLGTHKQRCPSVLRQNGTLLDTYICSECGREFKTKTSLQSHTSHCEKYEGLPYKGLHSSKYWNKEKQMYVCECSKEFEKYQSLNAHFCFCLKHKHELSLPEEIAKSKRHSGNSCNFSKAYLGEDRFNELHKNIGKSLRQNIRDGKTKPNWLGRKHSEESKEKIRRSTAKYIMNVVGSRPRYNKSSISILETIAKEHSWNIQHAENGGEFYTGIGYFVDAYDKEKNIVLEYDEAAHYVDAENNVLREKDLIRQKNIIKHLKCEYWRYNSVTQKLWKVCLQIGEDDI